MTTSEVTNTHVEVAEKYYQNEIQSRWGRAFFDVVFHGGLTVEAGVAAYIVVDAVSDSDIVPITSAGVAALSGLVATIALKRFSRSE